MFRIGSLLIIALNLLIAEPPVARSEDYASTDEQTKRVQYLLLWSGYYIGSIDGQLTPLLLQSVRDFQTTSGYRPSGVLDDGQISRLADRAATAMAEVGYAHRLDALTGAYLAIPSRLLTHRTAAGRRSHYAAPGSTIEIEAVRYGFDFSLLGLYKSYRDAIGTDTVVLDLFLGDSFILSWSRGAVIQITRFDSDGDQIRGLIIHFDKERDAAFVPLANAIINDFSPFQKPERINYLISPEIKRFPAKPDQGKNSGLSSSGSGFFVSDNGHILTNAHVIQKCTSIMIGKDKTARVIGIDPSDDLALVQVLYFTSTNVAQFAEGPVRLGTEVAAFGFPLRGILADQL